MRADALNIPLPTAGSLLLPAARRLPRARSVYRRRQHQDWVTRAALDTGELWMLEGSGSSEEKEDGEEERGSGGRRRRTRDSARWVLGDLVGDMRAVQARELERDRERSRTTEGVLAQLVAEAQAEAAAATRELRAVNERAAEIKQRACVPSSVRSMWSVLVCSSGCCVVHNYVGSHIRPLAPTFASFTARFRRLLLHLRMS
jgi:hypothetical protein